MQKIVSLFKRDFDNRSCPAYNEIEDGAEWVSKGEGVATQKLDGTACLIKDGIFYKRLKLKEGNSREGWIHWSFDPDQKSGHGWAPVGEGPEDHMHTEVNTTGYEDGTYELVGPRIGKNHEKVESIKLIKHGSISLECPRTFNEAKEWFNDKDIEGVVWHHEDGRMIKVKKSDFGMKR